VRVSRRFSKRVLDGDFQCPHVIGNEVGQVAVLRIAPPRLDRIQFRCVGRQPLEFEPLQPRSLQLLDRRAMHRPAVKNDEQGTLQLPSQPFYKRDHVDRDNVGLVNPKRYADPLALRRERNRTDHGQSIVSIPGSLLRSNAARCPGTTVQRLQTKASFIDKDESGATSAGLFLRFGQVYRRQCSTSSSSCSRATCCGFCGVNPKSCSNRPKWSGWYDTRNCLRTTSATRRQVHNSLRYPAARGPSFNCVTNDCFCLSVSLQVGPGCGRAAKACTPPVFQALFQRFTLDNAAPHKRATSDRDFRSLKYSAARRRRASSSAELPLGLIPSATMLAEGLVRYPRRVQ
jgi:hypothetical protein